MNARNESRYQIKVFGVGDHGCRIIDYLTQKRYRNLELTAVNTDVQSLLNSQAHNRILIGDRFLHGNGAKGDETLGRRAAIESEDHLRECIKETDIIFLTAGLGGGTGTGALPVIAQIAKEAGALTIGAVTLPFSFEGNTRIRLSNIGVQEIEKNIHTLITSSADNAVSRLGSMVSVDDAFAYFGDTLYKNVVGMFRLINITGLVNLDLSDVQTLLSGGSSALMAFGETSSEDHAEEAAEAAMYNAIGKVNLGKARNVMFSVTGSPRLTLFEVNQIASKIRSQCSSDVNLLFGALTRPAREELEVTILATGTAENSPLSNDTSRPSEPTNIVTHTESDAVLPRLKVFLCHSSTDKPSVRKLYQQLYARKGIDPWLDEAKLLPGVRWDHEIAKAVKESDVVIVCISKNSVSKEGYVQKEIKRALDIADEKPEETIFIIPLKVEDCDVPERLSQWQWVNYYEDGAFDRLISSLQRRAKSLGIEIE